jgi:hypothetical protein
LSTLRAGSHSALHFGRLPTSLTMFSTSILIHKLGYSV